MKKKTILIVLSAIIIISTTACSLVDTIKSKLETFGLGSNSGSSDTGVLFSDDFSSTSSGWDRYSDDSGSTDYSNGAYEIIVNEANYDIWANPYKSFTDVSVEVDATLNAGPEDNNFGILCRYVDTSNYYFSYIASDGYYGVGKIVDGEQTFFSDEGMPVTDAVYGGSATNHIRFDCVGSTFTLYVNDTLLAEYEDSTFSSGDVGLVAGTFSETGVDILFDNFVVKQP